MKKLKDLVLQKFIDKLVEELKSENRYIKEYDKGVLYDIPYIISPLYYHFYSHPERFANLISDLKEYPDYHFYIEKSNDLNYDVCVVKCILTKYENYSEDHRRDEVYAKYEYLFNFFNEERMWGFCDCTTDMKDYREDKQCCGHGCDAIFCGVKMEKVISLGQYLWDSDEHEYWEFEDSFYLDESELAAKKEERDKEYKIEYLKDLIENATKELAELEK